MTKARQLADLGNAYDDGALSNRNLIINGAMQVAQRGTSVSSVSSGYNTVDRWAISFDGDNDNLVLNMEQSSDAPDGFNNSLKLTVATPETTVATDEQASVQYRVEAQDLQGLAFGTSSAKSFTLSFYVKSSVTGDFAVNSHNIDASRLITETFTINSANTWEKKTITFAGDSSGSFNDDTGLGLQLSIFLMAGPEREGTSADTWIAYNKDALATGINNAFCTTSGATFQITGVQLEVGDTATPFEHRSYGDELAKCQRYYQHTYSTGSAVGTASHDNMIGSGGTQSYSTAGEVSGGTYTFKVEMRAVPSVTFYDHQGNSARCSRLNAGVAWYGNSNVGVSISTTTSSVKPLSPNGSTATGMYCHIVADAEL